MINYIVQIVSVKSNLPPSNKPNVAVMCYSFYIHCWFDLIFRLQCCARVAEDGLLALFMPQKGPFRCGGEVMLATEKVGRCFSCSLVGFSLRETRMSSSLSIFSELMLLVLWDLSFPTGHLLNSRFHSILFIEIR